VVCAGLRDTRAKLKRATMRRKGSAAVEPCRVLMQTLTGFESCVINRPKSGRICSVRSLLAPIVIAPPLFGSLPAFAPSSPSADRTIKSLKPSGNRIAGGTRGVRLAAPCRDATAPTTPAARPPSRVAASRPGATQTASEPADLSVSLTVNFATRSADLTADAIRTPVELGRALASKDLATYQFCIEGHTDTVGSREHNRALSKRRATAVVGYVAHKYGVDRARLEAVGLGEDRLLVQTPAQTPEPRNRRVQVVNIGA
jgi:outer membrane protein OmpA-like peptidoglycan-associated protein